MTTPTPSTTIPKKKRRWPWIVLATLLVVGAAAGYGIYWFLKDDAPPPVSLDNAVGSLTTTTDTGAAPTTVAGVTTVAGPATTTGSTGGTGVAGSWKVDPSLGEFSFEDATGSFVGFRIKEQLQGIGSTTAVGRTPEVSGTITIDGTQLTAASFEADLTSITTNDSRRNGRVQDALDTGSFPTATFTLTQPVELGDAADTGAPVSVQATGNLTVHGVTKPVTVAIDAKLEGDNVVVVGSVPVVFSDFDVQVPRSPVVVSAEDHGTVELQLLFTRS
jgi:polyisoprenoid-binding protein YceI